MYIHKMPGEKVEKGDILFTMYATSEDRLENGKRAVNLDKMYELV